ncbi:MAG: hypothetical protein HY925_00335, partial [Elusimicrobia bacterium]|nr:hypothetical protein [Elusimicrobiota bacterium]
MPPERCRLCGQSGLAVALGDARDHVGGDPFRVLRCPGCGAGFTDPVPSDLDRYYPQGYRGYGGLTALVLRTAYRWRVGSWVRGFSAP